MEKTVETGSNVEHLKPKIAVTSEEIEDSSLGMYNAD